MEVANCRLRLNKVGSDVPINGITPAEAMLLHILHGTQNGGMTFGEEFEKITVVGTAMVATKETKKVIDKPAVKESVTLGKVIQVAVPARVQKGKLIKAAVPATVIPAVPARGTPSQPDYVAAVPQKMVPAVAEQREPDVTIPAIPEVREPSIVTPAQLEISHEEPVLRDRTDAEELRRLASKYNGARDKTNKPVIESIWPDKLNPKLPKTFKEIDWQATGSVTEGVETAAVNYATGALATSALPK